MRNILHSAVLICLFVRCTAAVLLVLPHAIGLDVLCVGKEVERQQLSDWRCDVLSEFFFDMKLFRSELSSSDPVSEYLLSSNAVIPSACSFASLCLTSLLVVCVVFSNPTIAIFTSGAWAMSFAAAAHAALNHPNCNSSFDWFHKTPAAFECLGPAALFAYGITKPIVALKKKKENSD